MLLVITVYHALEECSRLITQRAGVKMNKQEKGQHKTNHDVQHIIEYQPVDLKDRIGYVLWEHQAQAGNDEQGHAQVHSKYIGYFLKGIEFLFFGYGEGMWFVLKDANGIEATLLP